MIFFDRQDAGVRLGEALKSLIDPENFLVIALPRGGVVVGYEVAKALNIPLDIVCPRKIGAPGNHEYAIGAVTETGDALLEEDIIARLDVPPSYLKKMIAAEQEEALKRLRVYRQGRPPRVLKGKGVILVDDGLATGFTMKAAIATCRSEGTSKIVVAVPVAPLETCEEIKPMVDDLICLSLPRYFQAIGQFYTYFGSTSDEEVIALMAKDNS